MTRSLFSRTLLLYIALASFILAGTTSAATVTVRFYSQGDLVLAERATPEGMALPEAAVRTLVAGPTSVEKALGYTSSIPAGTTINYVVVNNDVVQVDMSAQAVATLTEGDLTAIFEQFRTTLSDYPEVMSIKLTSGGNTLASYLPSTQPVVSLPRVQTTEPVVNGVGLAGRIIAVGPSHGRLWNGSSWGWQRSDYCGFGEAVLEDTNSIRLVQLLKQYLIQDGATFICPRQLDETDCCNSSTGLAWWKMCAQTWLHSQGAPCSVWANSSGNCGVDAVAGLSRSSDDIRARPLWADYNNADLYIAHHTNAAASSPSTATGTVTYRDTQMEHPEWVSASYDLASAVQSNIVSAIRTTFPEEPSWYNRGVLDSAAGFGEIRIPNRPACLVELAFHDDCTRDALYLTDDFFRSVAEWGIYKGICAYFGNTPTWDKYSDEYVSDTIPTTMTPGQSYPVSVTFRNRGVCWFTSRGFRLGAVGDSDPLAAFTRVDITGGVKPGQEYTFNFTLTAPVTGGTHTTDWQMVRDGYAWFGPVVSKVVDCGPEIDPIPPTVPGSFRTTSITASAVALAWDASTDNIGVTGYTIYRNGASIDTTTGLTYTDSNLPQNTSYTYEVDAYDAFGNHSAKAGPLTVKTLITATWGPYDLTQSRCIYYPSNVSTSLRTGWYTTTEGTGAARSVLKATDAQMLTMPGQALCTSATFAVAFTRAGTYSTTANNPLNIFKIGQTWATTSVLWNFPWAGGGNYANVGTAAQDCIYPEEGTIYTFTPTGANAWFPHGVMMKGSTESSIDYRKAWLSSDPYPTLAVAYTPPTPTIRSWAYLGHYPQGATADHVTRINTDHVAGSYNGIAITEADIAPGAADGLSGPGFGNSYGAFKWKKGSATNDVVSLLSEPFYNLASNDNGTTYAAVYVRNTGAPNSNVYMGVGSDDDVKVYLNGALVGTYLGTSGRGCAADSDYYGPMTLNNGWNRLLVKVENGGGGYGLYARFANTNRSALANITTYTSDATAPTNPTGCTEAGGALNDTWQDTVVAPSFSWTGAADPQGSGEGVSGIRGYKVYFGSDPAGVPATFQTAAMLAPGAQEPGVYYLRVSTVDYALNESAAATLFVFKYLGIPPVTTATPAGGVYKGTQNVVLSAPGAYAIYYTTDGSAPGRLSNIYSGPIPVSADTTLRFFAEGVGGAVESPAKQEVYAILTGDGSIAEVRAASIGADVRLGDKALYLKNGSFGYIEEADRIHGIRIEGTISADEGQLVCLVGSRAVTPDGEPCVTVSQMTPGGPATIEPWATNGKSFQYSLLDGLFITTWGMVKPDSVTSNSYVLVMGSADMEITVITKTTPTFNGGEFVIVSGAVGFGTVRVIYEK